MTKFALMRWAMELVIRDLLPLLADPKHHDLVLAMIYLGAALVAILGHRFMWVIYAVLGAIHIAAY